MRKLTDPEEVLIATTYLEYAANVALKSTCKKSQRGAVIVNHEEIVSEGYNEPQADNCCLRDKIHDNSRTELCNGIHAEQMSLNDGDPDDIRGGTMYIIKTKQGQIRESGPASCTGCSRSIRQAGIETVILLHKKDAYPGLEAGIYEYTAEEFNRRSYEFFGIE